MQENIEIDDQYLGEFLDTIDIKMDLAIQIKANEKTVGIDTLEVTKNSTINL